MWYRAAMNKKQIDAVLESVRAWPQQDQEELIDLAREIEARRTGIYALTDDERRALETARRSPIVDDDEVAVFWKRRGIA
jgi:hypothetical protein